MERPIEESSDFALLRRLIAERGIALGREVHYFTEVDSTSSRAKEAAKEGASHGALFLADTQTSGRGRQGRSWSSPRAENLLFSVVLSFGQPARRLSALPIVAGLSVCEAVARSLPEKSNAVKLKWPNDVWIEEKKVAGILVESVGPASAPHLIVGIGLNVLTRDFPPPLVATSLSLHTDKRLERAHVLTLVLEMLDRDLFLAAGRGLLPFKARLEARDGLFGKEVSSDAGSRGTARGIDEEGRLLVHTGSGIERWNSGEVHLGGRE